MLQTKDDYDSHNRQTSDQVILNEKFQIPKRSKVELKTKQTLEILQYLVW